MLRIPTKKERIIRQIKRIIVILVFIAITGYLTTIFFNAYMTSQIRFAILMLPPLLLCLITIALSLLYLVCELYVLGCVIFGK